MTVINYGNDIYEVENFLTEDEVECLLSSTNGSFFESHPGNIIKDLSTESLTVVPGIYSKIMSYFENAHAHTPITNIRRLQDNEFMSSHADGGDPNSKQKIIFGLAMYLNDEFTGGELNYIGLDTTIKPKKYSLVIHDAELQHEVLPVTGGVRYSITAFIFGDDTTRFKY